MNNLLLVLTVIATITSQAQTIQQGANLNTEFKKIETPYYSPAPSFTSWVEGSNMFLISSKPDLAENKFVFLALSDTTLIGGFYTTPPYDFLLDIEENSVLDGKSSVFILPTWAVKKKTEISSTDKKIVTLLDKIYQKTLQADTLELDEVTMSEYISYHTDTTLANRHIALMFDNYQTLINEAAAKRQSPPAEICVPLMTSLSQECLSIFNSVPVIVSIYMGEALQDAGMLEEASEHFKKAIGIYPNSIPLLVYNYMYEKDEVKKKYPKHWLVKDL